MPYQNRVSAHGELVINPARGTLMGNRGSLHDAQGRIGRRRWTTKSWVTCALSYRDWKQTIMSTNGYTQLFFLDEATALAAGHRPCGTCRRERFRLFMEALSPTRERGAQAKLRVTQIDPALHEQRTTSLAHREAISVGALPDGVMLSDRDGLNAWIKWRGALHQWSFDGYGPATRAPDADFVSLTPSTTIEALENGYEVEVHSSVLG